MIIVASCISYVRLYWHETVVRNAKIFCHKIAGTRSVDRYSLILFSRSNSVEQDQWLRHSNLATNIQYDSKLIYVFALQYEWRMASGSYCA